MKTNNWAKFSVMALSLLTLGTSPEANGALNYDEPTDILVDEYKGQDKNYHHVELIDVAVGDRLRIIAAPKAGGSAMLSVRVIKDRSFFDRIERKTRVDWELSRRFAAGGKVAIEIISWRQKAEVKLTVKKLKN